MVSAITRSLLKTLIFLVCIFLFTAVSSADFLLTAKGGQSFVWGDYREKDGNYCTWDYGGDFCIPKNEILSVKEIKERKPDSEGGRSDAGNSAGSVTPDSAGHATGIQGRSRENVGRANESLRRSDTGNLPE